MSKDVSFLIISLIFMGCSSSQSEPVEFETSVESIRDDSIAVVEEIVIKPGDYVEYHPNGNVKILGQYDKNSQRNGLWISYYDNGIKWSESYYVGGKRDGHTFTFYPNGRVRYRGEYRLDVKHGEWTFYDESGEITSIENY